MADIETGLVLLNELPTKAQKQCIETLIKIFRNIRSNPEDPKYRILKFSNQRFNDEVWKFEGAQIIMFAGGWEMVDESIQLPPETDVSAVLKMLIDNRDIRPAANEWVEENKLIGLSPARIKEEELKQKALKDKAIEMAQLKKDMAERKAIAERIVIEHRNDLEKRRATKPSKAIPLPSEAAGCSKMSDHISSQGE